MFRLYGVEGNKKREMQKSKDGCSGQPPGPGLVLGLVLGAWAGRLKS